MKRLLPLAFLLLATPAMAQSDNKAGVVTFTATTSSGAPVLQLGNGGCLKGPLTVFGSDGKIVFSLNATSAVGNGCKGTK